MTCLDSSFIIDFLRGKENARHIKEKLENESELFFIPSPAIMELVSGAYRSVRIDTEKQKIQEFLSENIVLDFDMKCAFKAGEIEVELEKKGQIIEPEDIMIAAIAIKNNEALVTANAKHFERIKGLRIESYVID